MQFLADVFNDSFVRMCTKAAAKDIKSPFLEDGNYLVFFCLFDNLKQEEKLFSMMKLPSY